MKMIMHVTYDNHINLYSGQMNDPEIYFDVTQAKGRLKVQVFRVFGVVWVGLMVQGVQGVLVFGTYGSIWFRESRVFKVFSVVGCGV